MLEADLRDNAVEAVARFMASLIGRIDDDYDMLVRVAEFFVDDIERRIKEATSWREIPDA